MQVASSYKLAVLLFAGVIRFLVPSAATAENKHNNHDFAAINVASTATKQQQNPNHTGAVTAAATAEASAPATAETTAKSAESVHYVIPPLDL